MSRCFHWPGDYGFALAVAFRTARRVDFATRMGWLLHLDDARAIAGGTPRFCNRFSGFHLATLPLVAPLRQCAVSGLSQQFGRLK
jgi:hypothetical protein